MITSNSGITVPKARDEFERSTLPCVYPSPPSDIVTLSTLESLFTTIVHSAPSPSPLMGTLVYVMPPVPRPDPLSFIVTILI